MMDIIVSPVILSSGLLIAAAVCYKEAMTPPNPAADESVQVDTGVRKLIPWRLGIFNAWLSYYIAMAHFALEIYTVWAVRKSIPLDLYNGSIAGICPAGDSSTIQRIHPLGRLSLPSAVPLCLILLGASIRITCQRQLGKMFTWETAIFRDHRLITSGPYRFVRHPSYTGYFLVVIGYYWFLWVPSTWGRTCFIGSKVTPSFTIKDVIGIIYALLYLVVYTDGIIFLARRSFAEDRMLKREFGKEWEEWARMVRWNIIPYII